ncbi:MAG: hypothetical protein ACYDCK_14170 [Thermoplasmatota archaeon]
MPLANLRSWWSQRTREERVVIFFALGATTLFALQAAWPTSAGVAAEPVYARAFSVAGHDGPITDSFTLPTGAPSLFFAMRSDAGAGGSCGPLTLTDPAGKTIVVQGPPTCSGSVEIPRPVAGQWKLTLATRGFTGTIRVEALALHDLRNERF